MSVFLQGSDSSCVPPAKVRYTQMLEELDKQKWQNRL